MNTTKTCVGALAPLFASPTFVSGFLTVALLASAATADRINDGNRRRSHGSHLRALSLRPLKHTEAAQKQVPCTLPARS
jgi:hypothetical protein